MNADMKTILAAMLLCSGPVTAAEILARHVTADLKNHVDINAAYWKQAPQAAISLMAQPMVAPRPKTTTTDMVRVKAVNNGEWIAFLLQWKDSEYSPAGRLGEFSDAIALEFPVKDNQTPPPVFMGGAGDPVHIFHWRAMYQVDAEHGKRRMEELYPNMNTDIYPMEFKDAGKLENLTKEKQEVFAPGLAVGNPQSYSKTGVDEIYAEGYSTSSVVSEGESLGHGEWKNGEWSVVITRALNREGGSVIPAGSSSNVSFAVWQGGQDEVGARKSLSMEWIPLKVEN